MIEDTSALADADAVRNGTRDVPLGASGRNGERFPQGEPRRHRRRKGATGAVKAVNAGRDPRSLQFGERRAIEKQIDDDVDIISGVPGVIVPVGAISDISAIVRPPRDDDRRCAHLMNAFGRATPIIRMT